MKLPCHLCTLIILIIGLRKNSVADELISVVVVFRHGDRSPIGFVKTDPYANESYWPVGKGQLTTIGKQQHYALGQWFRNRYDGFLERKYSEQDIYVRTTDLDRTFMSAASNLAGLYPPEGDQIWNEDIPWQPIPIHSVPQTEDYLLAMGKFCKRYDLLMKQLLLSPEFTEIMSNNSELLEYLTAHSGQDIKSLLAAAYLHDSLFVETLYNYPLPEWTKNVYPNLTLPLLVLEFERSTHNHKLAILKTGPFFYELIKHFSKFNGKNEDVSNPWGKKFTMLSAHDTTLVNLLNTMGVWDRVQPAYAQSLLFEMRQTNNGKKYINMFYKNLLTDVQMLILPGCEENCDFDKFALLLKSKSLSQTAREKICTYN